jgi:hypothetical protein
VSLPGLRPFRFLSSIRWCKCGGCKECVNKAGLGLGLGLNLARFDAKGFYAKVGGGEVE